MPFLANIEHCPKFLEYALPSYPILQPVILKLGQGHATSIGVVLPSYLVLQIWQDELNTLLTKYLSSFLHPFQPHAFSLKVQSFLSFSFQDLAAPTPSMVSLVLKGAGVKYSWGEIPKNLVISWTRTWKFRPVYHHQNTFFHQQSGQAHTYTIPVP